MKMHGILVAAIVCVHTSIAAQALAVPADVAKADLLEEPTETASISPVNGSAAEANRPSRAPMLHALVLLGAAFCGMAALARSRRQIG
jgi:hypothetical protein